MMSHTVMQYELGVPYNWSLTHNLLRTNRMKTAEYREKQGKIRTTTSRQPGKLKFDMQACFNPTRKITKKIQKIPNSTHS